MSTRVIEIDDNEHTALIGALIPAIVYQMKKADEAASYEETTGQKHPQAAMYKSQFEVLRKIGDILLSQPQLLP